MSKIDEFRNELRKHATPAAAWHKVDLHNHSPASHDFRGDRSTALEDYTRQIIDKRLSVVMFTDHERLPDADFVAQLTKRTGALILSGLELNVFVDAFGVPAEKVGKNVCFHLLIGFDPNGAHSPAYWVEHLHRTCRKESRVFGGTTVRGVTDGIEKIADTLRTSGAFIIPAHLHSGSDAFRSRSVDVIFSDQEFLRWTKEHFKALDVRSDKTADFFDGKHAETNYLEISCIRSSDAHAATELGASPTWVQMENVSFAELQAALELPGRVSRCEPLVPAAYVEGIHVDGQFLRDFWMTFSPYLNVLIGVKGSGKTSLLECLRFALGTEVPVERVEEVNKHLNAILGPAGRVRVLLKRDDGARILVERHISDRTFRIWFDDDRKIVVPSPESFRFPAAVLGWHEIEHAATDRQIRRLHMDAIAGREETKRLTDEARLAALSILRMHEHAAAKYNEFTQLAHTVQQQEAMRDGLQQLKEANLIELRDRMSSALADKQELSRLVEHFRNFPTVIPDRVAAIFQTEQFKFEKVSPLVDITSRAVTDLGELDVLAVNFRTHSTTVVEQKIAAAETLLAAAVQVFDDFANSYQQSLSQFSPEIQRLLESHREVLEKTKDLPSLRARLAQLKADIEISLRELADVSEGMAKTLDRRLDLRVSKVDAFNALLVEAGVQLSVVPGTAREEEFSQTFNQYGHAKEAFQTLRATHGSAHRFHRMLAQSYEELRADLLSGDKVVFSRAEFGHLITILENDDLDIRFAVGKPGEQFSPIDQLSAGQRCTAVFPILLKLRDGPLVVDQPEDNLDNRHIAKSVAVVLSVDKKSRQILMTSHNANLVVLSDPECIAAFDAESGRGFVASAGFLSHRASTITASVLDILDGGQRALELRSKKYGK